jgi:hypothetical protein
MTKEKFFLISLFKNNILNKDMREFTMWYSKYKIKPHLIRWGFFN